MTFHNEFPIDLTGYWNDKRSSYYAFDITIVEESKEIKCANRLGKNLNFIAAEKKEN